MAFSDDKLNRIYDRTDGCCHLCGKKHSFCNYNSTWEVEHSIPKLNGGTNHSNNLYVGCISCNRSKQANSTRRIRNWNGLKKAPLSRKKKQEQRENKIIGGLLILLAGLLIIPKLNNNQAIDNRIRF
jgi:hypothetical protein